MEETNGTFAMKIWEWSMKARSKLRNSITKLNSAISELDRANKVTGNTSVRILPFTLYMEDCLCTYLVWHSCIWPSQYHRWEIHETLDDCNRKFSLERSHLKDRPLFKTRWEAGVCNAVSIPAVALTSAHSTSEGKRSPCTRNLIVYEFDLFLEFHCIF